MIRSLSTALAAATLLVMVVPASAATTTITIAGYQFVGGGRITLNPLDGATPGSPAFPVAGTALSRASAKRGDKVDFLNRDVESHTIEESVVDGQVPRFSFVVGSGVTRSFTVGATWPLGKVAYVCKRHRGMIGELDIK